MDSINLREINLEDLKDEGRYIETTKKLRDLKHLIEDKEKLSGPEILLKYAKQYLNKLKELKVAADKESFLDVKLRHRICTFGRKAVSFGLRYLKFLPDQNPFLLEDSYMELEKVSRSHTFRKKCLEKVLELMEEYSEEGVPEFIGRRAEAYLDLGQLEKDKTKKAEYFLRAYHDSIKQIEDLNDNSDEALFKLAKICNLFSSRDVGEKLKEKKSEVIEKGISIVEWLRQKQIAKDNFSNPIMDNVLGFLYIRRARLGDDSSKTYDDFERGLSLVRDCLNKLNPKHFNWRTVWIFSYAGSAFSEAYEIKIKSDSRKIKILKENDLENLVTGIICSELSRDFGNTDCVNYQVIGREYHQFQNLIEKSFRNEAGEITIKKIRESVKEVLIKKGKFGEIFSKYNGGLRVIANLENGNV